MENRNTKEAIQKDIDFLAEIKENAIKWKEGNDAAARDMLYTLIDDWSNELSEGTTSIEERVLPISDVSGSLPSIDVEEIKGLKDSLNKTGYTTYNNTKGGLRFINDLLDKLIMFHSNDR